MVDLGTEHGRTGHEADGPVEVRRSRRREELLDCAIDAIRALGPSATMEQLAGSAGVTKPILYRHFGDRDGLIEAIAERFSHDLGQALSLPLHAPQDPRSVLDATVGAYVSFIEADPDLYRFLIQQPNPRGEHRTPIGPLIDLIAPQVSEVLRPRMVDAGRDERAALPWAYGIVGLVHQSTLWWLRDGALSLQDFTTHLTDLLWSGLSASVGSPSPT